MTLLLKLVGDNWLGIIIGACALAVLSSTYNIIRLVPQARKEGKDAYIAELAIADAKNEARSKGNFSDLQNKSDYDFCVSSLTRRKLPIDACEQLLGISEEQPKP